jgi:RND family efflux transporter MFP subunit
MTMNAAECVRVWARRFLQVALSAVCIATLGCRREPEVVAPPPPEVSVSRPVERKVADFFETTGETAAVESVDVRARVSGYLTKVNFEEGSDVKQGDVLFEIDERPFRAELQQAQAELATASAQLKRARAAVARIETLLPRGAASARDYETSIAAKETAEAQIQMAQSHIDKANLQLEWARVTAPINGRIGRARVTVGNLIQLLGTSSDVLTTIVRTDPAYVYFEADEASMLRRQQIAREAGRDPRPQHVKALGVPVWIALATDTTFSHQGLVDFIDNRVDPSTGTIKIRGVFKNEDSSLTPGMFVRVRVPFTAPADSVLVTERALGSDQGNKYLLVVNESDVVEYRAVTLGALAEDGLRVIRQGLQSRERVIVNGLQRVRPGVTVRPREVEMIVAAPAEPNTAQGADAEARPHGG